MQNTGFSRKKTLNINGQLMILDRPVVMGILNITPDSFYRGSRMTDADTIVRKAEQMLREGARILDVGGYSTRPGADEISVAEEKSRVLGAIDIILKKFPDTIISVDTFRSEVASAACGAGAAIINDISAGELDNQMFKTVAELHVPYVLMHMRGNPKTMTKLTTYDNLLQEIRQFFHRKIAALKEFQIKDIVIDPGFGFAKTREQNFELLNNLEMFGIFDEPLLVGLSRKSMIWKTLDQKPDDALNGTTALNTIALMKGASIVRVHDVKECVEVIRLMEALRRSTGVEFS